MNTQHRQARSQLVVILATVCLAIVAGKLATPVHAQETERLSAPQFTVKSRSTVQDGSFQLSWSIAQVFPLPINVGFELQQSKAPDFASPLTMNVGPDRGTFVSGLPNGRYYYRVRMIDPRNNALTPWSAPVTRDVQHHSIAFALSLMSVGSVVFILTVAMVLYGVRVHGQGDRLPDQGT